jgi:thiol-disulfide isomerase/thioredoxin
VMFWGTTCAHCLDEIPAVARFAQRQREAGRALEVLAVCVDEADAAIVRDVAGDREVRSALPLYVDPSGTARLYYDVQSLPSFVLIDASGWLVARAAGARNWDDPALDALVVASRPTD